MSSPTTATISPPVAVSVSPATASPAFGKALALLRIVTGSIFLWAFLDQTFGWGYATSSDRSWLEGTSPAEGYLSGVAASPFESTFHDWAGQTWVDLLYMGSLLGVGAALVLGIGLRLSAIAGTALMLMMWATAWPPARSLSDGSPSYSPNPLVDKHVIYALVMIALAVCSAGRVWGLGRSWAGLPIVQRYRWLQ